MNELIFIEKAILESLLVQRKNIFQLSTDLNIKLIVLSNILFNMMKKNLISFSNQHYQVNFEKISEKIPAQDSQNVLTWDAREIVEGMLEEAFICKGSKRKFFKIQKVFISDADLPFFQLQMSNMEKFLYSLPKQPVKSKKMHEKSVFCWGLTDYNSILSSIIN